MPFPPSSCVGGVGGEVRSGWGVVGSPGPDGLALRADPDSATGGILLRAVEAGMCLRKAVGEDPPVPLPVSCPSPKPRAAGLRSGRSDSAGIAVSQ